VNERIMSEINIYYSKIAHELSREPLKSVQRSRAQVYLIQGCKLANKRIIDISLSFGASLLTQGPTGITPLEILRETELRKSSLK
jgi:hypothetical protein